VIFANIRDLKNKTSEYIKATREGNDVIITFRGKPTAVLRPLNEDEFEDYILNHPKMRAKFEKAYREYKEQGGKDLDEFARELES
jgi:prevent-host-death family protein